MSLDWRSLSLLLLSIVLMFLWYALARPDDVISVILGSVTFYLSLLALDLAIEHRTSLQASIAKVIEAGQDLHEAVSAVDLHGRAVEAQVGGIGEALAALNSSVSTIDSHSSTIGEEVRMFKATLGEAFGLSSYIDRAADLYQAPDTERVVTSLKHWVATGDPAKRIQEGLKNSSAKELVFVGQIGWDKYLPGVLWRFVTARDIRNNKTSGPLQRVQIIHVNDPIPTFVVTRQSAEARKMGNRGRVLIGNPLHTSAASPNGWYGVNLGSGHPDQVDYYNFLFDALICPHPLVVKNWNILADATGIREPRAHMDGLHRIFLLTPFMENGSIYSQETVKADCASPEDELIRLKAQLLASQIVSEFYRDSDQESEFLLKPMEIASTVSKFLSELRSSEILEVKIVHFDDIMNVRVSFSLKAPFTFALPASLPTCDRFFGWSQPGDARSAVASGSDQ